MGRTTRTALGVAFGVTAALAAAALWLAMRAGAAPTGVQHALIGDALLAYPAGYARAPMAAGAGRLDRLDLAAAFPGFEPAGTVIGATTEAALAERTARTVFVTVTPDDKSLDPTERPARLYAPFLEPLGFNQPAGLVLRRFSHGSPYEGEDLYLTPPEGRAFWARCQTPGAKAGAGGVQEPCFTELRQDGLNLTLRFAPALLPEWERLRDGASGLIKRFRQRG